jgi:subtilisin family serine protease
LAEAIIDCVAAGARVLNLSAVVSQTSFKGEQELQRSLDYAASRGVISVAAAGDQGMLGSTVITRHPGVIPVVACDDQGRPTAGSNLGPSIGRRGVMAPGRAVTSLGPNGEYQTFGGSSAAAPFVTGAMALLWSEFPSAHSTMVRSAVTKAIPGSRPSITPRLLNAGAALQLMNTAQPLEMVK